MKLKEQLSPRVFEFGLRYTVLANLMFEFAVRARCLPLQGRLEKAMSGAPDLGAVPDSITTKDAVDIFSSLWNASTVSLQHQVAAGRSCSEAGVAIATVPKP